jgi:hypothetical protein
MADRPHAPQGPADSPPLEPFSRADLHLHTEASIFKYFKAANTRDSYNDPDET